MVMRSDGVERERSQLLQKLFEVRQQVRQQGQQLEELQERLESEEQSGDLLKARNYALESDNAELLAQRASPARQEPHRQPEASAVRTQRVTGRAQWMPRQTSPPKGQASPRTRTSSSTGEPSLHRGGSDRGAFFDRLQEELRHDRSEREASGQNLAGIRSSHRLLLAHASVPANSF